MEDPPDANSDNDLTLNHRLPSFMQDDDLQSGEVGDIETLGEVGDIETLGEVGDIEPSGQPEAEPEAAGGSSSASGSSSTSGSPSVGEADFDDTSTRFEEEEKLFTKKLPKRYRKEMEHTLRNLRRSNKKHFRNFTQVSGVHAQKISYY